MNEQQYREATETIMKKVAAVVLALVITVTGCVGVQAGQSPDTLSQGDTGSLVEHAKAYWSKDKEPVQMSTEPLTVPPAVVVTEAPVNEAKIWQEAVASTVKRFRDACLDRSEFYIYHNGSKERYACMSLRNMGDINWDRMREKYGKPDHEFKTN